MPENSHWMMSAKGQPPSRMRQIAGGLFVTLFGGVFLYFLVPEIVQNLAAANWLRSSCTILSATIATDETNDDGERRELYKADLVFSYEYDGKRYESSRFRFVYPFTNDRNSAERSVAQHPAGSVVLCYVNPQDPTQAVLDRRISAYNLIVLLPAAIAALGLWSTLAAIFRR